MKTEIELMELKLKNFKGVTDYNLKANGKNIVVAGKNGTGKTTLIDAWSWLMTGSNSDQQAKFNIFELNGDGTPVNNQDAIVTAVLRSGKKKIELRKEHKQKWTKKRGQESAEFTGNTTEHYWDGLWVSKTDYEKRLATLAPVKVLRMISDVNYFCGQIPWEERRKVLLSISGDVPFEDICAKVDKLNDLPQVVGDMSLDDCKKMLKQNKKAADKQLDKLPDRIDELKQTIPNIEDLDEEKLRQEQAELNEKISAKKNLLVSLSFDESINHLKKERSEVEVKISRLQADFSFKYDALYVDQGKINQQGRDIVEEIDRLKRQNDNCAREIKRNDEEREILFKKYQQKRDEKLIKSDKCYACGQHLPEEMILDQEEKFQRDKESTMKDIELKAQKLKQSSAELSTVISKNNDKYEQLAKDTEQFKYKLNKINDAIKALDHERLEVIEKEKEKIDDLNEKIDNPNRVNTEEKERIEIEIGNLSGKYEMIVGKIAQIAHFDSIRRRIEEREADLERAVKQSEQCARDLYLLELYSKERANHLEKNVDGFFEFTQWKLFEVQTNQGIREVCEAVYNGVPYNTDLNTGAKINCGIDCINALTKHFGVRLPVFIDNAESITTWEVEPKGQIIKMVASANVEKLEVINE